MWFYLWKLIWPSGLCFVYPRWQIDERHLLSYLPVVLWVILLAAAWRRRRTWGRSIVMLIVCYGGLLLPALGFVNIYFMRYSLVADHYQYAAMIVPCAVFAAGVAKAGSRDKAEGGRRKQGAGSGERQSTGCSVLSTDAPPSTVHCPPSPVHYFVTRTACLALLLVLAVLTWRQSRMYSDVETLYQATIDANPGCWMAHANLGNALADLGRLEEAIAHYRRALEIKPDDELAHNILGNALAGRGQFEEAIAHYRRALEIRPNYADAHDNLGNVLASLGRTEEAIAHFEKALEIEPKHAAACNNLAWLRATDPDPRFRNGAQAVTLVRRAAESRQRSRRVGHPGRRLCRGKLLSGGRANGTQSPGTGRCQEAAGPGGIHPGQDPALRGVKPYRDIPETGKQ